MRHHDDRPPARLGVANRVDQRLLTLRVEIRVGLVEDQHGRVAVERARQRYSLALAAREALSARPDLGVVTLRQGQDSLMGARAPGGGHHLGIVALLGQAGDVLVHGAGDQPRVLRQVADMPPQGVLAPLVEGRPVEAHLAGRGPPEPGEDLGQRGLARPRRADHAQRLSRPDPEADIAQDWRASVRRRGRQTMHVNRALGRRQAGARRLGRRAGQEVAERRPSPPRALNEPPLADCLLDRGESPAEHDRGGDHHACRDLLPDHQPGARREDQRLEVEPQRLRCRHIGARTVGGGDLMAEGLPPQPEPAPEAGRAHAERAHGFGILPQGLAQALRALLGLLRRRGGALRAQLIQGGQHDQERAAPGRDPAEKGMEQEDHPEEERRPRNVEQREWRRAGEQVPHGLEILRRRGRPGALARCQRALQHRGHRACVQEVLDACPGARENPPAHELEQPHHRKEPGDQEGQRDQRLFRAAGENAVIDLQHEQRAGQRQQVDENAEQRGREEVSAAPSGGGHELAACGLSAARPARSLPVMHRRPCQSGVRPDR